jgi:hypothetical protein
MTFPKLSQPIPVALLPHNVTLKTSKTQGIFTDGDYDETEIYNVRIEVSEKTRQSGSSELRTRGAKLYYDTVNSTPKDMEFKTGQLIVFGGDTFKIDAVRGVMSANKIHHYRVEMI